MTNNCATFTAQDGQTYGFYSAGHDAAGNVEPAHSVADTTTTEVLGSLRLTARQAGHTLDLSWPVAIGHLQATTNLVLTNWSDVPNSAGTNHIIIPIDRANPREFYRLTVP